MISVCGYCCCLFGTLDSRWSSHWYQLISLVHFYNLQEQPDNYDLYVKGMVLDMRSGRPADRTKTPDEIAQEEKEELERLEVNDPFSRSLPVGIYYIYKLVLER